MVKGKSSSSSQSMIMQPSLGGRLIHAWAVFMDTTSASKKIILIFRWVRFFRASLANSGASVSHISTVFLRKSE